MTSWAAVPDPPLRRLLVSSHRRGVGRSETPAAQHPPGEEGLVDRGALVAETREMSAPAGVAGLTQYVDGESQGGSDGLGCTRSRCRLVMAYPWPASCAGIVSVITHDGRNIVVSPSMPRRRRRARMAAA